MEKKILFGATIAGLVSYLLDYNKRQLAHKLASGEKEYLHPQNQITKVVKLLDGQGRNCVIADGDIFVWKACKATNQSEIVNVYVQIFVPGEAKRVTPVDFRWIYKSRIEYGLVVSINDSYGNAYTRAQSFVHKDKSLDYVVDEFVKPDSFNDEVNVDCGAGINVHCYKDQCTQWFNFKKISLL